MSDGQRNILTVTILDNGELLTALDLSAYSDIRCWGLVLADVARHVWRALAELRAKHPELVSEGATEELIVGLIVDMMQRELNKPTTNISGTVGQSN